MEKIEKMETKESYLKQMLIGRNVSRLSFQNIFKCNPWCSPISNFKGNFPNPEPQIKICWVNLHTIPETSQRMFCILLLFLFIFFNPDPGIINWTYILESEKFHEKKYVLSLHCCDFDWFLGRFCGFNNWLLENREQRVQRFVLCLSFVIFW